MSAAASTLESPRRFSFLSALSQFLGPNQSSSEELQIVPVDDEDGVTIQEVVGQKVEPPPPISPEDFYAQESEALREQLRKAPHVRK